MMNFPFGTNGKGLGPKRTRVDKRVFWPQYYRKIEYVCLIGFRLILSKRYHVFLEMTSELLIVHVPLLW